MAAGGSGVGGGRTDVSMRTDASERVHLEVDTHEGARARASAPKSAGAGTGGCVHGSWGLAHCSGLMQGWRARRGAA